jgi:hypothetical protein
MAKRFLINYLKLDDKLFEHSKDCVYLMNNYYPREKGKHRYLRGSMMAKFMLRNDLSKHHKKTWDDVTWGYAYHGT